MASKAISTIGKYAAKKIGNKTFDKAIQKISEPYERLKRKYLFCPKCKGTHINEEKGIEKIKQALGWLKSLPNGVLEKMMHCLQDLVYEDHRIELEHKKYLERKLLECDTKQERWHELYAEASITRNIHSKKIKELAQEKEKIAEQLLGYNHIAQQNFITLNYLTSLYFHADQIWDFPKNEQKQKILKLLCSEILLDRKKHSYFNKKAYLRTG